MTHRMGVAAAAFGGDSAVTGPVGAPILNRVLEVRVMVIHSPPDAGGLVGGAMQAARVRVCSSASVARSTVSRPASWSGRPAARMLAGVMNRRYQGARRSW